MVGQRRVGVPDGDGCVPRELWSDRHVSTSPLRSLRSTTNLSAISAECMADDNRWAYLQKFDYSRGSTKIKVAANQYANKDFCLDLGVVRGRDATNLHLYECVDVPQQQFWITDTGDDHIALEGESSGHK